MLLDFGCNCHRQTSVMLPLHADISTYGAAGTYVLAAKYATACRELECCQLTSILIKVSLQIIAILFYIIQHPSLPAPANTEPGLQGSPGPCAS